MTHFAFGSKPASSSSVESRTPVHSEQDTRPCSACAVALTGWLENIGALLPLHSTNAMRDSIGRSEEHTSELQSRPHLVCRLLLEKKKKHLEDPFHFIHAKQWN